MNGVFVICKYDMVTYLGTIINSDDDEDEVEISFMTTHGKEGFLYFRWPKRPDTVWFQKSAILGVVDAPEAGKRCYKLNAASMDAFLEAKATDAYS